jgi:drug/metabolite transporter (DMT)-like permease
MSKKQNYHRNYKQTKNNHQNKMLGNSPIIAIILSAIGNILMSLGAVIQKRGAEQALEIGKNPLIDTIKSFLTNKTWLKGAVIALVGLPVYFLAFQYGDLIYVQPMIGLGTLAIVLYALKILKEKTTKTELLGILFVILGPIIIAYGSQNMTQNEIQINYNLVIIFFLILYLIISMLILIQTRFEKGKKKAVTFAIMTGGLLGLAAFSGRLSAFHTGLQYLLFIGLLLLNLGFGTVSSQIMYQKGRAIITLNISNSFNLILPAIAGIFILSEKTNFILVTGLVIILLGCVLLSRIQSIAIKK